MFLTCVYVCVRVSSAAACTIPNANAQLGNLCACNTGFVGSITWDEINNMYSGTCSATATECGSPPSLVPPGYVQFSDSNNHGSVATFTCNPGFELSIPNTNTNSVECSATTAGQNWPSVIPACNGFTCARTHTSTVLRIYLVLRKHAPT